MIFSPKIDALAVVQASVAGLFVRPNDRSLAPRLYSGFLVAVRDRWFWVTAAHVLKAVQEAEEAGQLGTVAFLLKPGQRHIQVDLNVSAQMAIDWQSSFGLAVQSSAGGEPRDELERQVAAEMDIGIVQLNNEVVVRLIEAGAQPLREREVLWDGPVHSVIGDRPALYFLIGFPWSLRTGPDGDPRWSLLSLALNAGAGGTSRKVWDPPLIRFEPEWGEENFTGSVLGMSGGPVFLFVERKPYLVGVQAKELPNDPLPRYLSVVDTRALFTFIVGEIDNGGGRWELDVPGLNTPGLLRITDSC